MRTFHYLVAYAKTKAALKSFTARGIEARCFYTKRALNDILLLKEIKF